MNNIKYTGHHINGTTLMIIQRWVNNMMGKSNTTILDNKKPERSLLEIRSINAGQQTQGNIVYDQKLLERGRIDMFLFHNVLLMIAVVILFSRGDIFLELEQYQVLFFCNSLHTTFINISWCDFQVRRLQTFTSQKNVYQA